MDLHSDVPAVIQLSDEQLRCYNNQDTDAFCACYHDEVKVMDAEGNVSISGIETFRERYHKLFTEFKDIRADIIGRLHLGPHSIEHEIWRRTDPKTGETQSGEVLVRYTEKDGKLWLAEFLKKA